MKSVRIQTYSGLYIPAFGLNTDQNNSEYGYRVRSATGVIFHLSCYVITINFNVIHYRLGKHVRLKAQSHF